MQRFARDKLALGALIILMGVSLCSVFAEAIAPFSDHYQSRTLQNRPPGTLDDSISRTHLLGTDDLGRDIFSRLLYATRTALLIAFAANCIIVLIGLPVGLISGYLGGLADDILMRLTDIIFAFPGLLFAMVLAAILRQSAVALLLALGLASWGNLARLVRAHVLRIKQENYVLAAKSIGMSQWRILAHHILPNILSPVIVLVTLNIPGLMSAEATLSFLGIGFNPSQPSLGGMINSGRASILSYPTQVLFPVCTLALLTLAFNLIGDALRDVLDTRT